ncbi:hypothetical protein [Sinomicrobium weinanense]|uniref:Fibronectin type-III domain-containing protein n=1 Tax=Sinomicrobium weinanense TaxID=2842200 RepID=A0A926JP00_9FLAO|nr:hypothetical protein [Sinomicrobium weinanense]MBC9794704.1 hypothetical protein [Sinomicrobium weinanense]MBU3124189.1 hypothetical protein [Sinomicrobium weinanense]
MTRTDQHIRKYITTGMQAVLLGIAFTGCDDIAEVPDISDKEVVLIAPTDEATVKGNAVTFTWQPVEDAESYILQVATPDFPNASQVVIDHTIERDTSDNVLATSYSKEMLPRAYEWRVKAVNSGYETPFSTNAFILTEGDAFSDNTVVLNSPENNLVTNEAEIALSWGVIEEATGYRVQILDAGESVVQEEEVTEPSLDITFEEGGFTWQVRAEKDAESTLYTSRELLIDLTVPNTPELTAPVDESTTSETEITFTWSRENISGSAEYDKISVYSDESLETLVTEEEVNNKTFTATLEEGTYYWNVKSFDRAGNEGELSSAFSFTIN